MTDKPPAKSAPAKADKSEVILLELPGLKVSLANERYLSAPAKPHDDATGTWLMAAIIAAIVLGGLVVVLERVRQRG